MKKILRAFLINLISLWLVARFIPAFTINGGFRVLIIGSFIFMLINLIVNPLIRILLLPINILTLGLFSGLANVVGLYILTIIVPQFKLLPFRFNGGSWGGFSAPALDVTVLEAAIITSLLLSLISGSLRWICKD